MGFRANQKFPDPYGQVIKNYVIATALETRWKQVVLTT